MYWLNLLPLRPMQVLLFTEGIELQFTDGAIRATAQAAEDANNLLDNIGARRLHTVLERILTDISFTAPERAAAARGTGHQQRVVYTVDESMVQDCMQELLQKQDLSKYVL